MTEWPLNEISAALANDDLPTALDKYIDAGVDLANRCDGEGQAFKAAALRGLVRRVAAELDHDRARQYAGRDVMNEKIPPAACAGTNGCGCGASSACAAEATVGGAGAGSSDPSATPASPAESKGT